MDKKIRIINCYWCPHVYQERGNAYYCGKADKPIVADEIEKRACNGELEQYVMPAWCPLEDY